jgi:hypothetical protein
MTYRLKVNQQWKIALALIFIPVFFMLLYIGLVLAFRDLPGWAVLLAVIIALAASLAVTLFVVFRWLTVEADIILNEQGFHFKLVRETPFMHLHEFHCNWENIENVSINEDSQHDSIFYSIHFRNPGMSLYLTDTPKQSIGDGTGSAFWQEISKYVEQFNNSTQSPSLKIRNIGFYEKPWAKAFTYFTMIFTVLIVLASVFSPDEGTWWRAIAFSAFAIPWLLNYYRAKSKREENIK